MVTFMKERRPSFFLLLQRREGGEWYCTKEFLPIAENVPPWRDPWRCPQQRFYCCPWWWLRCQSWYYIIIRGRLRGYGYYSHDLQEKVIVLQQRGFKVIKLCIQLVQPCKMAQRMRTWYTSSFSRELWRDQLELDSAVSGPRGGCVPEQVGLEDMLLFVDYDQFYTQWWSWWTNWT